MLATFQVNNSSIFFCNRGSTKALNTEKRFHSYQEGKINGQTARFSVIVYMCQIAHRKTKFYDDFL